MKLTHKEPLCSTETRQRLGRIIRFGMRVSFFYMIVTIGSMQLLLAHHDGNGQNISTTYVTIGMQNEGMRSLFEKIEEQTSLRFTFREELIKDYTGITLAKGKRSVKEVLDMVVEKETSLTYLQIDSNYIIIKEKDSERGDAPKDDEQKNKSEDISFFTVIGAVTDASTQEPMAGVNVIVKGTTRGTVTDADGKYAIDAEESQTLVFTFIGFVSFETQVGGRSVIDVPMEEDIAALKEVVVNAGYWQVADREKTGNISRVDSKIIEQQPVGNVLSALEGRMPGVYIQQTTGVPGGGFSVQIRGQNSLRSTLSDNGNLPLYIINGVPFISTSLNSTFTSSSNINYGNPLSAINPSDIESIEVLKDADATAIYGSRGANGVILITTKKGKVGKPTVSFDFYKGVGKVGRKMDLLNTDQYLKMRHEAFQNDGVTPASFDYDINGTWDTTRYTDWQKELIGGTANITSVQGSLAGGNSQTRFLVAGRVYKEGTVFPGDFSDKRISTNFNLNHTSDNQKFKYSLSVNYVSGINNLPNSDLTGTALRLPPNAPKVLDEDGNLNWENSTWTNPLAPLKREYTAKTDNLISSTSISYELFSGLDLMANLGYNNIKVKEIVLIPLASINPLFQTTGTSVFADAGNISWIAEPQLDFEKNINLGKIKISIGTTFQENETQNESVTARGFTSDASLENIRASTSIFVNESNFIKYRYNAIFGRINYNWDSKYILNLTGRRDGSSRFSPGKQFANFGAIGIAWIFSNENFVKNNLSSFLSFGKIRSSFGTTGSDQIPAYGYLDSYSSTTYPYNNTPGLIPTRIANPDYAWESNKKLEAALELGFIEDRIFISASWYRNRSSNQLVGYPLPVQTGFPSVQSNIPATVQNKGWELSLDVISIKTNDLTLSTNFNISIPRNKLISYPNIEGSSYNTRYVVGKSLFIRKLYHFTGLDTESGTYTIQDVDSDDMYTINDRLGLKQVSQDFYGGLQNTLRFKGFSIDVLFQFVKQTGFNSVSQFPLAGSMSNQAEFVMNRWQKSGDNSEFQKFTRMFTPEYSRFLSSDFLISDASFIRLKNISLSYEFPKLSLEKLQLKNLKLYVLGQNIFTSTNYKGMDPETQNTNVLPPLRILTLGMQLTF